MKNKLIIIFLISFVLRLLLINVAYHGDLNNNVSWGNSLLKYGTNGYYEQNIWEFSKPNQPPLYVLLFGVTSWLFQSINNLSWYLNNHLGIFPSSFVWFWQTNGMTILVKMPSILADIAIGFLIYKFFERRKKEKLGFKLAALWLFNPITFYNSSVWGQTDPLVNLLGLISIFFLLDKKLIKSLLFLTLSLLFKGSLTIFVPILIIYTIWQRYDLKTWIKAVLVSIITVVLISIWFHPHLDLPIWLLNLYTQRFFPGEIGDLSANAFNFWYLVNPGKVLDSIKYFGISAHTWGYLITITVAGITLIKLNKNRNEKNLLFSLAIIALVSFLFMTRIHERYLYPFFPIATILIGLIPELVATYFILSVTFLINMYNLFWAPGVPFFENILKTTSLPDILAIVNLLALAFLFFFLRI